VGGTSASGQDELTVRENGLEPVRREIHRWCVHAVVFALNSDERILEDWVWEVVQKAVKSGEKR
jgi:hypothetical protein